MIEHYKTLMPQLDPLWAPVNEMTKLGVRVRCVAGKHFYKCNSIVKLYFM